MRPIVKFVEDRKNKRQFDERVATYIRQLQAVVFARRPYEQLVQTSRVDFNARIIVRIMTGYEGDLD